MHRITSKYPLNKTDLYYDFKFVDLASASFQLIRVMFPLYEICTNTARQFTADFDVKSRNQNVAWADLNSWILIGPKAFSNFYYIVATILLPSK